MRTVRYDRFDGIDQIYIADMPDPEATPGQIVVRVRASGINPGSLSALNGAKFVPARDLAGEVVAVGKGVSNFSVDAAVLGWVQDWLAHAQLVTVPATQLISKPEKLSWDVAGSLYVTSMAGLAGVKAVAPKAGELIVVSGASGGVGSVSAQLARQAGATVIGLTGADNSRWLEAHGIIPVVYGDGQEARIRAAAGNKRIDAFIDTFGVGYIDLALALGVSEERINTVVDFKTAQEKGVKTLGTMQAGGIPALQELAELVALGKLDIPIAASYSLDQVQEAYRKIAGGRSLGKVVLHPQE